MTLQMQESNRAQGSNDPGEGRPSPANTSRVTAGLLLVFGLWGTLAPYASTAAGYHIPVPAKVEFVDHVVPGAVILAAALFAVFSGKLPLLAALAATLGGFWMTMTHLLTLRDGFLGRISLQATLIHSLPGLAILIVAGAASARAYRLMPD